MNISNSSVIDNSIEQYCTFKVAGNTFGIPVLEVQEVIKPLVKTDVPLAKEMVRGLINLRGQIVTLIGLRELFDMPLDVVKYEDTMNIVVRADDNLIALVVDSINDVVEVEKSSFTKTPATIDPGMKPFIKGIHKLDGDLMIVLDLNKIINF